MTISEEAALIHLEVAKLRPDKHRRYPKELKQRIREWAERAIASGIAAESCARMIGMVRGARLTEWLRGTNEAKRPSSNGVVSERDAKTVALVPVAVEARDVGLLVVVTSAGHRIEGLSLAQVRELLMVLP